jgi:hypothetical protein
MKAPKARKLTKAGWKIGTPQELLQLTAEEVALVEIRLALAASVRKRRLAQALTQSDLARRLRSSQSRIAKLEAADPSVTIDLLIRSLLALGASRRDVARMLGYRSPAA